METIRFRAIFFAALALTAAVGACGRDRALAACEADGGAVVANTGTGEWAEQRLRPRLVELWRAGAPGTDPGFGYPADLAVSPLGRVAVADFERDEVSVFSPDGSSIGTWPRDDQLGKPVAVAWGADESLHIFDLGASALVTTDAEGHLLGRQPVTEQFLDRVMADGGLDWAGVLPNGTVFLQLMPAFDPAAADPAESRWVLWRQRAGEPGIDTVAQAPARLFGYTMQARTPVPSWPRLRAAAGSAGVLALGGEDGVYRIRIYDEAGRQTRTICRDAAPLPLTAEEQGEVEGEVEAELLREAPRPSSPAAFGHFFLSREGRLFVQRDRPMTVTMDPYTVVHGNPGGLFDVFDAEGRYLGELRAPANVRLRAAAGERVWGLETAVEGAPQLVAYELRVEPASASE